MRRGEGSMPARLRMFHMVEAAILWGAMPPTQQIR